MLESIEGQLKDKDPIKAIVQTGGLSYRLSIPLSTYAKLPSIAEPVFLYLSQVIREDAHTLYAFAEKAERDLFETLLTISGVGPKMALTIVGHMDVALFEQAIYASDLRLLSKLPGIGKKTAERLLIEMRDKLKKNPTSPKVLPPGAQNHLHHDAIQALIHLGYPPLMAQQAVDKAQKESPEELDLSQLIRSSLQKI